MESLLRLLKGINVDSVLAMGVNTSPIWGLFIFLFKFYFRKLIESHRKAETRLVRMEEKIDLLTNTVLSANPTDLKKDLEEVIEIQKTQGIEIQAQWEAIRDLRRLRTRELSTT